MFGSRAGGTGGAVRKSDVRNNAKVLDQLTEAYVRRTGLHIVTEVQITTPISIESLERILATPNAELRRNGQSRVRGIRGALIHSLATGEEDGHAMAVLDRRRLGSLGKRLERNHRYPVANILADGIFGTCTTNALVAGINEAVESGVPVFIRHVARAKK